MYTYFYTFTVLTQNIIYFKPGTLDLSYLYIGNLTVDRVVDYRVSFGLLYRYRQINTIITALLNKIKLW